MIAVTDADRKAAEELRVLLADVSGFWHRPDDDGALCKAMARHREQCEMQLLEKMSATTVRAPAPAGSSAVTLTRPRTSLRSNALAS